MKSLPFFLLPVVAGLIFLASRPQDEREIGWNAEIEFPIYADYTSIDNVTAARIEVLWDTAHFQFVEVVQGPMWSDLGYFTIANTSKANEGILLVAHAGTLPLYGDSLMLSVVLRSKEVSVSGEVLASSMFNEVVNEFERAYSYRIDQSLPVELAWFGARVSGETVTVTWKTLSEVNAAKFVLEALPYEYRNGQWVEGLPVYTGHYVAQGTSVRGWNYDVGPFKLAPGMYRFRLMQIDFDGAFEVFETDLYEVDIDRASIHVYPNPSNPSFNVQVVSPVPQRVILDLYDIQGRKVLRLLDEEFVGVKTILTDTQLPTGTYFVVMKYNNKTLTRKILHLK